MGIYETAHHDDQPPRNYRGNGDAAPRTGGRNTLRVKHKAVPKGHEAFLKALETSGATVEFEKAASGERIVGQVKASDKFTISVRIPQDGGGSITRVLFKHDISEFSPIYADGGPVTATPTEVVGE